MEFCLLVFLIFQPISLCVYHTTIAFTPDDLAAEETTENGTRKKAILRYGFHRTSECHDYEKAYICIQKCLDFHYDIAYADKNCYCTCYSKKEKAKYSALIPGQEERWKLGAPTTKIPVWAQKKQSETPQSYPEHEQTDNEDVPENRTVSTNYTQVDTENSTPIGMGSDNVNAASNATKSDHSSSTDGAVVSDQTTDTNVIENTTIASQNTTA